MKAAFFTLGCKVNQYDSTAMAEILQNAGYEIVSFDEYADVYIVNTCTVTNVADKKSRNMIRRAKSRNKDAVLCACGCLPQKDSREVLRMDGVDAVIGTGERSRLLEILGRCQNKKQVDAVRPLEKTEPFEVLSVSTSGEKTRAHLKIQEGCNQFCSYCIIPHVRGRSRSRHIESILSEAQALAQNGFLELVLTGINISAFGKDTGESLASLILALDKLPGIRRIRLGSLEPPVFTPEFIRRLQQSQKVCPHFHLSLQSGSDTVLQRMNRKYTTKEYAGVVQALRQAFDRPAITTDIIAGFPGETEDEFQQTFAFTRQIGFSRIHVFPYSERAGTPAAQMDGSVPKAVRKKRAQLLIELGNTLEEEYAGQFLGTLQQVLFEDRNKEQLFEGYTDRYLRVAAEVAGPGLANVLLKEQKYGIMIGSVV
ncbi:MAG: tRNA (N(6)-L-threonylcarbamoyladenosine(37)-C(2))-methylthiotransferase MtaB [Christensenellaceae bacterium]|jgi:threonylcarbamoyladenosine tRNA methylthiotransferase MtaB